MSPLYSIPHFSFTITSLPVRPVRNGFGFTILCRWMVVWRERKDTKTKEYQPESKNVDGSETEKESFIANFPPFSVEF